MKLGVALIKVHVASADVREHSSPFRIMWLLFSLDFRLYVSGSQQKTTKTNTKNGINASPKQEKKT